MRRAHAARCASRRAGAGTGGSPVARSQRVVPTPGSAPRRRGWRTPATPGSRSGCRDRRRTPEWPPAGPRGSRRAFADRISTLRLVGSAVRVLDSPDQHRRPGRSARRARGGRLRRGADARTRRRGAAARRRLSRARREPGDERRRRFRRCRGRSQRLFARVGSPRRGRRGRGARAHRGSPRRRRLGHRADHPRSGGRQGGRCSAPGSGCRAATWCCCRTRRASESAVASTTARRATACGSCAPNWWGSRVSGSFCAPPRPMRPRRRSAPTSRAWSTSGARSRRSPETVRRVS